MRTNPLHFSSAREALKVLADLEMAERGSDALGYEAIRWNATVRFHAYAYLREHPIEAGCARADDFQADVTAYREIAARAEVGSVEYRACLDAAAVAADMLSAQIAELAKLTARGEAA